MNWKSIQWKIFAIALIAALLAGCQGARQAIEPTVNSQPTYAAIQTQAVETAIAQMTLLAPTAAPVQPTEAAAAPTEPAPAEPAPTEAPLMTATAIPSFTAVPPTAIPTNTFVPWTATPRFTATSSSYSCSITEFSPAYGYEVRAGGDFDGRWVVKNNGSETWRADEVDVKYVSGTEFQDRVDAFDLPSDVAKKKEFTIVVDMLAPDSPGTYTTYWAVVRGGTTLCSLPLTIRVP